ncbi:MAG TPA: hypothetical protein VHM48_04470 [Candidatus Limnocylindrales bacterium]|nr:hypothetical protein [Candidatus Limnocylindrales bacterium]
MFREAIEPYVAADPGLPSVKLSISLPADLAALVRSSAAESGSTVSATIAAALRRTLGDAEQARLDAALELDREENLAFAQAYAPMAAELLAKLTW